VIAGPNVDAFDFQAPPEVAVLAQSDRTVQTSQPQN
jgi:hypothetical protein